MDAIALRNLASVSLQAALIVAAAAALPSLLRVSAPGVRYVYYRAVLLICLALPWMQSATPAPPLVSLSAAATAPRSATGVAAGGAAVPAADPLIDWTVIATIAIAAGVLGRLAWLGAGYVRLRRLRRVGERAPELSSGLQDALGTRAEVRFVEGLRQPVTFGVRRPIVLLPRTLLAHPADIREAVIAHELTHVRRRDWLWVVIEEAVRSVVWFHPALWWLISRVQLAREEVVDAAVIATTGQRRAYVRALLAFADATPLAPAPAFAWRRHLFRRIVLVSQEEVMSARRLIASCVLMTLVVAGGSWYAIQAFPIAQAAVLRATPGPLELASKPITAANPLPKRAYSPDPVYPAATVALPNGTLLLSAAVTLRTTVDEGGNVGEMRLVGFTGRMEASPGAPANVTIEIPSEGVRTGRASLEFSGDDTPARLAQALSNAQFRIAGMDGVFEARSFRPVLEGFVGAAAEAVQAWRYEPPRDGPVAFNVVLDFRGGRVQSSDRVAATSRAIRVGGNIKTPTKIHHVAPVYPPEAREQRVQGVVIIEAEIGPDGSVASAQVLRSIPLLDAAALDAIRQWRFTPTLLNGAPVPVIMTMTVQFSLEQ